MMRFKWTFLLLLPLILIARDNPFSSPSDAHRRVPAKSSLVEMKTKQSEPKTHQQSLSASTSAPEQILKPKIHPQRPVHVTRSKAKIHPQRNLGTKEVFNFAKARFIFRENSAYIETKDRMIRHFSIANPPSIVIDFRGASDFASKRKQLHTKPFTKLEMGAHGNRYRVVFRLEKSHKYKINKRKYGQVVTILK